MRQPGTTSSTVRASWTVMTPEGRWTFTVSDRVSATVTTGVPARSHSAILSPGPGKHRPELPIVNVVAQRKGDLHHHLAVSHAVKRHRLQHAAAQLMAAIA
jgi:hypothetical protein